MAENNFRWVDFETKINLRIILHKYNQIFKWVTQKSLQSLCIQYCKLLLCNCVYAQNLSRIMLFLSWHFNMFCLLLVLDSINFFIVAWIVLCFRIFMKVVLITGLKCCWAVLMQSQGLFIFLWCSEREEARVHRNW